MQLRIISDGTGADTYIIDEQGNKIEPVSATIDLDANQLNRVSLTFVIPAIDVRAYLGEVTLICPTCGGNQTHPCTGPPDVPNDPPRAEVIYSAVVTGGWDAPVHSKHGTIRIQNTDGSFTYIDPAPVPDDKIYGDDL